MVKFGIRLAIGGDGHHVDSRKCSKLDGPFICLMCDCALTLRSGKSQPGHFIHKKKSDCIGNTDEHRNIAESLGDDVPIAEQEVVEQEVPVVEQEVPVVEQEVPVVEQEVPVVEQEVPVVEQDHDEIIKDALDFVTNEILKPTKCTDCKIKGTDHIRLFTEETIQKYGLNDIYVCPRCFVECPNCKNPNSKKRDTRVNNCFTCDMLKTIWVDEAHEAMDKMTNIPDTVDWLSDEREYFVLQLLSKKNSARIVRNFMKANKNRISEYKVMANLDKQNRSVTKALKKARKEVNKNKEKNIRSRNRMAGSQATERYNMMFANKKEQCLTCGKENKRRYMVKYESIMGAIRYCCKGCSDICPGCNSPSSKTDLKSYGGNCFQCLAWSINRSTNWLNDKQSVLKGCMEKDINSICTLYIYAPLIEKGKYVNDKLVHVNTGDLDSISRRDHPEMKGIIDVIKHCRKV